MDTLTRRIDISCAISVVVERFLNGFFSISENVLDKKSINSLNLVSSSCRSIMKRKVSNKLRAKL